MQKKLNPSSSIRRLGLIGVGRTGQLVKEIALERGLEVVSVHRSSTPEDWKNLETCDAWIEFALAEGFLDRLDLALHFQKPFIVGTTALDPIMDTIEARCLANQGSVLLSSNFSIGTYLFAKACYELTARTRTWSELFHISELKASIEEIHHTGKKDAPSGTAFHLRQKLQKIHPGDIPIYSQRKDPTFGVHRLQLEGINDQLLIEHTSLSRRSFAEGALFAANWLTSHRGFFTLDDVIDQLIP